MHQSGVKILKLLTSMEMGGTEQQVVHDRIVCISSNGGSPRNLLKSGKI